MSKTASRFTESQEAVLVPWYSCISFSKEKRRNCSSTVDAIQSVEQPGMGRGYKCQIFEKVKSPYRVNFFEAKRDLCRGIPRLPATTWTKTEDSVGNLSCIFELFKPKTKMCEQTWTILKHLSTFLISVEEDGAELCQVSFILFL